MTQVKFNKGELVVCLDVEPLKGNSIAPPLKSSTEYSVNDIAIDKDGNQHLDVGLISEYSYVSSYETGEHLPNGDKIHWCHPSRFKHARTS